MQLDPHIPASPEERFTFTFRGSATPSPIVLVNVTYGEVYLCSGQSNMVVPLSYSYNYSELAAELSQFANMRFFRVPEVTADTPQPDADATWHYFDSNATLAHFPAVCFLSVLEVVRQGRQGRR